MPFDTDGKVIDIGQAAGLIVNVKVCEPMQYPARFAVIVKRCVFAVVVVPLSTPVVGLSDRRGGKVPVTEY